MRPFRSLLPRTLFARALIILITPLVLVQIVAAAIFYDRGWESVTRRLANAVAGEMAIVIEVIDRLPPDADVSWLMNTASFRTSMIFSFEAGARLPATAAPTGAGLLESRLVNAMRRHIALPYTMDVWGDEDDVLIAVQLARGVMRVEAPRARIITSPLYYFIAWMIGSSLIFFAIASLFMRNQVRPIRRLAHAAEEFGKGRDVPDFRPAGAAEVRQAAAAFIDMRERLRRFLAQRTEMLAGVSHDLRTPLTRMKLELAMLGENPMAQGLRADVADMERMVDSYLAFARGEGEEASVPVQLKPLLEEIAATARREGSEITLTVAGDLGLNGRTQALKRGLRNLIDNAARHAGRVSITAERRAHWIEILIDDDGPGIPAESREDVFKPFFRLDPARGSATGGVGLGLTIARDTARGHGGDVVLEDSPMGGLRARVTLPV